MTKPFQDHFSGQADSYAHYRPGYPSTLFDYLADRAPARTLAWDCATGSGQAACELAKRFRKVIASDASQAQIDAAISCTGVEYRVARAEQSGLDTASVDLVTVAQALHWFDLEAFYREVERILRPSGLLAVWSYNLLRINPPVDRLIDRFYRETLADYWPPERKQVEEGYAEIDFPFRAEADLPCFDMSTEWSLPQLIGYLGTWSATSRYREATGQDPLQPLAAELQGIWGEAETRHRVRWPLSLRLGYRG
ncbi:MAG: class I SAM-dependent methyltransferase [Sedimenticola sp.]|nr:class I SAM-dependent methyltransferase [Sedimenticola sp.]